MNLKQVREIAKSKGVNPNKMKKAETIKAIQRAEGNFDCFGTAAAGYCDQVNCIWINDCLGPKKISQVFEEKIIEKIKVKLRPKHKVSYGS